MRFFLDENLPYAVAVAARQRGLDIISSADANRNGIVDEAQMLFAAEQDRCLITANCKDFRPLTHRYVAEGLPHAGVLCISRPIP